MANVRRNVLETPDAETFLAGAVQLSQRPTGVTPAQLNQSVIVQRAPRARLYGTAAELARPLSWWDLFTWWHIAAMNWPGVGNRAHRGPVFLPWHRLYLRRLEQAIQAVTGEPSFALPYWDWTKDGSRDLAAQLQAPIWSLFGPPRGTITQGVVGQLRVRLFDSLRLLRVLVGPPHRISREASDSFGLPVPQEQAAALNDSVYDSDPWSIESRRFRNKVEGFVNPLAPVPREQGAWMHNRVHMWVAGDMAPSSSPNDPLFWLNHCNVDRIWEGWMTRHGRQYLPQAGEGPPSQRGGDQLFSIVWPTMTPNQLLDPGPAGLDWYEYDKLPG